MLISPITCNDFASFLVYSAMIRLILSVKLIDGYTEILSPEWIPARSTCSMIPGIRISVPSQTASTSTSLPTRYLSIKIGCSCS